MIERIEINLLPAEYRVHKRVIKLHREIVYPLILVIVGGMIIWAMTTSLKNETKMLEHKIARIEIDMKKNRHIEKEINKLRDDNKIVENKILALERINVNKEKWVRLMEIFCRCLPNYTWIVSLNENGSEPSTLTLEGRTFSFPEVATYMANLKNSEYIQGVGLTNIEQKSDKEKVFSFVISCEINPNAGISDIAGSLVGSETGSSLVQNSDNSTGRGR